MKKFLLVIPITSDSRRISQFLLILLHQFCISQTLQKMYVPKLFSNITLAHLEELRQLSKKKIVEENVLNILDLCQLKIETLAY